MRRAIYVTTALSAAALLLAGCGKKGAEGPSTDALKAEIAGVTGELNAYLEAHNFSNTDAGPLAAEAEKAAGKFGELEEQAGEMKSQSGDERYGDLGTLAGEGRAGAEALAATFAAGPPMGDVAKMAALNDAIGDWVDYNDRIGAPGAPPGEAEPAPPGVGEPAPPPGVGEPAPPPGVGEPAPAPEPGEPGVPPEPGEPGEPGGAPRYPGKGHHYGWWKNPEWARDRGTRPLGEGEAPGVAEKERERERERAAKGAGPERKREREREHVAPGAGEGAGPGPGVAPGGTGAGKGTGKGKGKGKGKGADAAPGGAAAG
jgi:hypothetical protein